MWNLCLVIAEGDKAPIPYINSSMHTSVLLNETIDGLELHEGETVLDMTLGDGGHSYEICQAIGEGGTLIGFDQDQAAIDRATKKVSEAVCTFITTKNNFRNLDTVLSELEIDGVDKFVFDLGLRTGHLEESGRGFTFREDQPLLMTFDSAPGDDVLTAYEVVNTWSEDELTETIKEYGEERFARRIAHNIVVSRKEKYIGTTGELVAVIEASIPKAAQRGRLHPATKTFQAIRMAVNDELGALEEALEKACSVLRSGGRIAVISFHGLEDRLVKHFFKHYAETGTYTLITKKPIVPTEAERVANPRSRSAKLRIIQKL
jgi:16S rRNA (cytosine1402-N4)-methyltransferase